MEKIEAKRNKGSVATACWRPLLREGTLGVEVRVLVKRAHLLIANLRFDTFSHVDEHSAPFEVDVVCLSGEGFISLGGVEQPLHNGQTFRWPSNMPHRLWTQASRMETLMIEHRVA